MLGIKIIPGFLAEQLGKGWYHLLIKGGEREGGWGGGVEWIGASPTESCYSHPIRHVRTWKTAPAIVTPRIYHCSCYAKVRKPLTHHPCSIHSGS